MKHVLIALRAAVALAGGGAVLAGIALASGATGSFSDSVTGAPSAPEPASETTLAGWDVQVHSREPSTWYQLESMTADHGANCAGPPSTHTFNGEYDHAVFQCRDHVMTSLNASGYGLIYLTPDHMVDFASGTATIRFELSTLRQSQRDWADIWITPFEDNLAAPFDMGDVDLQGIPRRSVHIAMDQFNGDTIFRGYTIRDFQSREIDSAWWSTVEGALGDAGLEPSASVRQTYELQISKTRIKFGIPALNYWPINASISDLGWSQGVVQFGHHSYTPRKDNAGIPATWHWDAFSINPAVQFTNIGADRRYIDSSSQTLTLDAPAPTNAFLRFTGIGTIDVSYNGGPYSRASKGASSDLSSGYKPERMSSYWTPIPAGTTNVKLRFTADGWYQGPYIAKDFAVWAAGASGSSSTPTATPTSPTATPPPGETPPSGSVLPTVAIAIKGKPAIVAIGETTKVVNKLTFSGAATANVTVQIVSPTGAVVYEATKSGIVFAESTTKTVKVPWTVPSGTLRGKYTVRLTVTDLSGAVFGKAKAGKLLTVE